MNIKIKKKILVCMLWLCAIACFTGFPWIFFSWDVIHSYMGIHDIPSDLTIVLFREECLFFDIDIPRSRATVVVFPSGEIHLCTTS